MSIQDLHICQNSIASDSSPTPSDATTNATDLCYCPPEYIFTVCQEDAGFSQTSLISWQHFPRSTSSRSRCDDSEEIQTTITKTKTLSTIKEEKESTKVSSTEYPITKSFSQLNALHYLEIRHIFQFFNFLMSHLVCNEPEDPVRFLIELLDKCLAYRDSFGEPPHLFTGDHLKSVYNAFDPFERGYLTLNQYREAMKSLGLEHSITPYNEEPPLNEEDCVDESNFLFEAERCLTENLKQMLRIPKLWEENRLMWKAKMAWAEAKKKKKKSDQQKEEGNEVAEEEEEEEEEEGEQCRDSLESKILSNIFSSCSREQEIRHEPEQLFLN